MLAAPVCLSNLERFGDPHGVNALIDSARGVKRNEAYGGLLYYLGAVYPWTTFLSYWAAFGWMMIVGPSKLYLAFLALSVCGLLGFGFGWLRDRRAAAAAQDPDARAAARRAQALRLYLLAAFGATFAAHLWINLQTVAAQGRHLFAAAPQVAALLGLGLAALAGGRGLRARWPAAVAVAAGMLAPALFCLIRMLMPVYAG